MWGDHFLVAPVVESAAQEKTLYLPHGSRWDFWTGERIVGSLQESNVSGTIPPERSTSPGIAKGGLQSGKRSEFRPWTPRPAF